MKTYSTEEKTVEELANEANKLLQNVQNMTMEEEKEDDADSGYFDED